jgi:hypothetical protein
VNDLALGKIYPPVSMKAIGRLSVSVGAWILVMRPPRDRSIA